MKILGTILALIMDSRIHRMMIPFAICLAIILLGYPLPEDDYRTFLIFGLLIIVFVIYKFDFRIPIANAILLLLITAITSSFADYSANRFAELAYWLLAAGLIVIIINMIRSPLTNRKIKS
jgi:hypothetical protein